MKYYLYDDFFIARTGVENKNQICCHQKCRERFDCK